MFVGGRGEENDRGYRMKLGDNLSTDCLINFESFIIFS